MENAADALKMAAAALIFIIAIASSFSLFGTAKQTADSIIGMRDKQAYLEAADLEGVLYTTSDSVKLDGTKFTENGDRIVSSGDVISTIYRYNKEKYGVTIVKANGEVIKRYDSNTESVMRQYNNITAGLDVYKEQLKKNTTTKYAIPDFENGKLKEIYAIKDEGNSKTECGAPWYGNDEEVKKRINADMSGKVYEYNGQKYNLNKVNLLELLKDKTIVEVTNEIDQSDYLEDNDQETNLLQQYQMPTVEIIYILY